MSRFSDRSNQDLFDDDILPKNVAIAWGVKERRHRGRPRSVELEEVIDAAIVLAQDEGIEAVSMARVAEPFGFAAMSLYRYVESKERMVLLMVDRALGAPRKATKNKSWRQRLTAWSRARRRVLQEHPWIVGTPYAGMPITPNEVAWFEEGLSTLSDTPLSEAEKLRCLRTIDGYLWSEALRVESVRARQRELEMDDLVARYVDIVGEIATPDRFPAVQAMLGAKAFERDVKNPDIDFGIECILDGVENSIAKRGSKRKAR